jgi:hypothetical protein
MIDRMGVSRSAICHSYSAEGDRGDDGRGWRGHGSDRRSRKGRPLPMWAMPRATWPWKFTRHQTGRSMADPETTTSAHPAISTTRCRASVRAFVATARNSPDECGRDVGRAFRVTRADRSGMLTESPRWTVATSASVPTGRAGPGGVSGRRRRVVDRPATGPAAATPRSGRWCCATRRRPTGPPRRGRRGPDAGGSSSARPPPPNASRVISN